MMSTLSFKIVATKPALCERFASSDRIEITDAMGREFLKSFSPQIETWFPKKFEYTPGQREKDLKGSSPFANFLTKVATAAGKKCQANNVQKLRNMMAPNSPFQQMGSEFKAQFQRSELGRSQFKNLFCDIFPQAFSGEYKGAVLEIGCGTSAATPVLESIFGKVCGMDADKTCIARAQKDNPASEYILGDASKAASYAKFSQRSFVFGLARHPDVLPAEGEKIIAKWANALDMQYGLIAPGGMQMITLHTQNEADAVMVYLQSRQRKFKPFQNGAAAPILGTVSYDFLPKEQPKMDHFVILVSKPHPFGTFLRAPRPVSSPNPRAEAPSRELPQQNHLSAALRALVASIIIFYLLSLWTRSSK